MAMLLTKYASKSIFLAAALFKAPETMAIAWYGIPKLLDAMLV